MSDVPPIVDELLSSVRLLESLVKRGPEIDPRWLNPPPKKKPPKLKVVK